MKNFLVSLVATAAMLAASAPAFASPITYDFTAGSTVTFGPSLCVGCTLPLLPTVDGSSFTDSITGSFTYDSSANILSAVDITISGPYQPDSITSLDPECVTFCSASTFSALGSYQWIFYFANTLSNTPDNLTNMWLSISNTEFGYADSFSGGVAPAETPLPAALPLFAAGLGALGLLGRRRKRKGQVAA